MKEVILVATCLTTILLCGCFSAFLIWFCCFGGSAAKRRRQKKKVGQAQDDLSMSSSPASATREHITKGSIAPQKPLGEKLKTQLQQTAEALKKPNVGEDRTNLLREDLEKERKEEEKAPLPQAAQQPQPTSVTQTTEKADKKSLNDERPRAKSQKSDVVMVSEATSPIDLFSSFEDDYGRRRPYSDKSKLTMSRVQVESFEGKQTLLEKVNAAFIDDTDDELAKVVENKSFIVPDDGSGGSIKNDNKTMLPNVIKVKESAKSDDNLNYQYSFLSTPNSMPLPMSRTRTTETRATETDNGCLTSATKALQVSKEEIENELYMSSPENVRKRGGGVVGATKDKLKTTMRSPIRDSFKTPLLFRKKGEKNFIERNKFLVSELSFLKHSSNKFKKSTGTKSNDQSWH